jgi:hypothetical protein
MEISDIWCHIKLPYVHICHMYAINSARYQRWIYSSILISVNIVKFLDPPLRNPLVAGFVNGDIKIPLVHICHIYALNFARYQRWIYSSILISVKIVKFLDTPFWNPLVAGFFTGDIWWYMMLYQDTLGPYLSYVCYKLCQISVMNS